MTRCLPLALLMVLFAEGAQAQVFPPIPPLPPIPMPQPQVAPVQSRTEIRPPDEIVEVVPGNRRMTTKIAFVVDTSGSMNNSGRVQMGITFARDLLGRPGDELLVQMFAFKSGFTRWPGVAPDPREVRLGPPPPHGWTEFPSRIAQENAQQWLTGQGANGGTNPVGAMTAALQLDQRDLTVVLITDGEFGSNVPAFLTTIEASQIAREKRGLGRATIFVIGTGPSAENEAHLGTVGRRYGGGLHIIRPRRATPGPTATQRK